MDSEKCVKTIPAVAAFFGPLILVSTAQAQLNCNVGVEYYPDGGGIKRCVLNGEHTLYTAKGLKVICADGKALTQYPGGALRSCSIEKSHAFNGVLCEPPAEVEFEPDGRLRTCRRS